MGTSGSIGFVINGKKRHYYVHSDSYISGVGAEIETFLLSLSDEEMVLMGKNLEKILWEVFSRSLGSELTGHRDPDLDVKSRGTLYLSEILDGTCKVLPRDGSSRADLAYTMDFDKRILTVRASGKVVIPFKDLFIGSLVIWDHTGGGQAGWETVLTFRQIDLTARKMWHVPAC